MSRMNSASLLRVASNPLLKSIAYLPTAIIGKLKRTNKMAPESHAEDEEIAYVVVELSCGQVLCKTNDDKQSGARFSLSNSNGVLANLSVFEATRCPMCEHNLLANKDIGSKRNSAVQIAEKYMEQTGSEGRAVLRDDKAPVMNGVGKDVRMRSSLSLPLMSVWM